MSDASKSVICDRMLSAEYIASNESEGSCDSQEVEYVKQEAKLVYLLECLQKTAPPVLIFAEKQTAVDDVHEYLMSKDVDAVAVHGQKTQEERAEAIDQFKVCCAICCVL